MQIWIPIFTISAPVSQCSFFPIQNVSFHIIINIDKPHFPVTVAFFVMILIDNRCLGRQVWMTFSIPFETILNLSHTFHGRGAAMTDAWTCRVVPSVAWMLMSRIIFFVGCGATQIPIVTRHYFGRLMRVSYYGWHRRGWRQRWLIFF